MRTNSICAFVALLMALVMTPVMAYEQDERLSALLADPKLLQQIEGTQVPSHLLSGAHFISFLTAEERQLECSNEFNCDAKDGFGKLQFIVIRDSPVVRAIVLDGQRIRLPSEYAKPIMDRIGKPGSGIQRAQCDWVTLVFTGMGNQVVPNGPFILTDHLGHVRNLRAILKPLPAGGGLTYYGMATPIADLRKEGRAVRLHLPNELLLRATNPVVAIQVWEDGRRVEPKYLPENVQSLATMFSTPANAESGRENALHLAAKNGRRAFVFVVDEDACN